MSEYVVTELNTHVNSYYINLAGGLDNLAWALSFELKLHDPLSEEKWESRRFCSLTRPEFSRALDRARPGAATVIARSAAWLSEIRQFRDPAAHRLPLTVVAAVFNASDVEAHRVHQAAASQALGAGDLEQYRTHKAQARTLGTFYPLLEEPRAPGGEFIIVPNQIAYDQERFIALGTSLVRTLADPGPTTFLGAV